MSKSWDNSILKKLKALMGKGLSTSEIGKRLGLSKNAVVGKIHRLGWNIGGAEESKPAAAKKSAVKKVAPKKPVVAKKAPAKASAKKSVPIKKAVAKVEPKKKKTAPKVAAKPTKKVAVKAPAPKKEADAPKKAVGRAITGRNSNIGVHQRIVQHALEMANLKPDQCRWPIGDPDSEGFHFCGAPVFVGKPYCYEHCKQAYQFTPPKKK